ncbi:BRCT domain [Dillenia turbinata]|uniref:BRCT domain n=1 Tax=Dillenia turbinata TaxID=194707 RepID=A0AAN8YZ73_9MAGN
MMTLKRQKCRRGAPNVRSSVSLHRPVISDNKTVKRNLPSWMGSGDTGGKSRGKKPKDDDGSEEEKETTRVKPQSKAHATKESESSKKAKLSCTDTVSFSKLLDGVVFVLSGFVNPERSILRSRALEMGAEYQPDWNSNCTLLVCAFPNTPKFLQVEADCGTIVSKDWISECYNQRKLVDIEKYLMHAGKPWRRGKISLESSQVCLYWLTSVLYMQKVWADRETPPSRKFVKQVKKGTSDAAYKGGVSSCVKEIFAPSEVRKWVLDDLNRTISWLESQDEKPEPSELENIAAEGILTCLQDAIDSLQQEQDFHQIIEQWSCIPRVVEELAKLQGTGHNSNSLEKKDICKHAMACKKIYEAELHRPNNDSSNKTKRKTKGHESEEDVKDQARLHNTDAAGYNSDDTIEMTEEEIDFAFKTVSSKLCKC